MGPVAGAEVAILVPPFLAHASFDVRNLFEARACHASREDINNSARAAADFGQ